MVDEVVREELLGDGDVVTRLVLLDEPAHDGLLVLGHDTPPRSTRPVFAAACRVDHSPASAADHEEGAGVEPERPGERLAQRVVAVVLVGPHRGVVGPDQCSRRRAAVERRELVGHVGHRRDAGRREHVAPKPQPGAFEPVRALDLRGGVPGGDGLLPRRELALEVLRDAAVTAARGDERGERGIEVRVPRDQRRAQGGPSRVDRVAVVVESGLLADDERDCARDDEHDQREEDPTEPAAHRRATLPADVRAIVDAVTLASYLAGTVAAWPTRGPWSWSPCWPPPRSRGGGSATSGARPTRRTASSRCSTATPSWSRAGRRATRSDSSASTRRRHTTRPSRSSATDRKRRRTRRAGCSIVWCGSRTTSRHTTSTAATSRTCTSTVSASRTSC